MSVETKKPLVSVILTPFNHGRYLREAIDTVQDQTFTDFEQIIWDDAPTDESWRIIHSKYVRSSFETTEVSL